MKKHSQILFGFTFCLLAIVGLAGCSGAAKVATSIADANQKPPVNTYTANKPSDAVFTAASQAMGTFGKIKISDRASGVIQGEKGNWVMNANISPSGAGSKVSVSARFVPSKRYDFNSRDGLTAEFISLLEQSLGEKVQPETIITKN